MSYGGELGGEARSGVNAATGERREARYQMAYNLCLKLLARVVDCKQSRHRRFSRGAWSTLIETQNAAALPKCSPLRGGSLERDPLVVVGVMSRTYFQSLSAARAESLVPYSVFQT